MPKINKKKQGGQEKEFRGNASGVRGNVRGVRDLILILRHFCRHPAALLSATMALPPALLFRTKMHEKASGFDAPFLRYSSLKWMRYFCEFEIFMTKPLPRRPLPNLANL